jgi:membrane associated rhomboid family serine protease
MGIADRRYMGGGQGPPTYKPPRRGLGGEKPFARTVNGWLIILCIAVFVIDGFFASGNGAIETGRYWVEQSNGTWIEVTDTPFFANQLRGDDLPLGDQVVAERVVVVDSDGTRHQETISGLPVKQDGVTVAIAEGRPSPPLQRALHFSTKKVVGGAQLWRLIGFQFLHADMLHLMFNMIALYFFGPLIEGVLGGKRYLAFYLLCGISGGLMYLLLNLAGYIWVDSLGFVEVPGLLFNAAGTPLIGASAGVFGVLVGGAFLAPNVMVLLFFVLPMRLATVAWVLIAISIGSIFIGTANAGGEAAHLGGALAGFGLIRHPDRVHRFFDWLGRFDPTSRHFRKSGPPKGRAPRDDEVDRILAKISREGLGSLTKREKKILQQGSRREGGST